SDWLIPIHLVRKPDGRWRFCLDLRRLNLLTVQDNYPLPKIQTITDEIRDMRFFTKLDIKDGFFRVPLEKYSQHKTNFKVGANCYKFVVLPMGYRNAPNIFQRVMENILQGMIEKYCIVYIDNILVYSKDMTSHKEHITAVLKKLKEYGMEINWKKAVFATEEMEFLGYKIGYNTIRPLESRIQGIKDYPEPQNKKQLRSFIGLLGYDRRFLWNISDTLKPLHNLTKVDEPWKWTETHQNAFDEAKEKLIAATELVIPDYTKRFTLETDASDTGIGAVLKQESGTIGYYSGTLTETQQKYTITEKELYAVIWGMEKCKYYLQGVEFDLITDHQAITYYQTKPDFGNSRIKRWYQKLDEFSFTPKYRRGEDMIQADALSRSLRGSQDMTHPGLEQIYRIQAEPFTADEQLILQKHEEWDHRKAIRKELLANNIRVTSKKLKIVLNKCRTCLERDDKYVRTSKYIDTSKPGELMGIDLMQYANEYVIVMIDYFTRKIFTKAIKTKEATKILTFIERVYKEFKFGKLISDRGKEFENNIVQDWLHKQGIEHILRPAYRHQGTGRVERVNRTLRNALNKKKGYLRTKLASITENYNQNMIHRAINMTPNQAQLPENWDLIKRYTIQEYKKEFKEKELPKFTKGDKVLIRNDVRTSKDDKHFERVGTVIDNETTDTYLVQLDGHNNSTLTRHFSQLKVLPRDVVY
ncbi:hypothetical protein NEIRO03_0877, partial [Nematocida sp. AWRm78]